MYAIKGGWVGQTFALAKSNESGGKKSRIRRSKEDRKAMVESFVKRYQNSNNGNFPSLNLTHKEVGGSFYTVRELVREIIQENRVLGPAKPNEDEQEIGQFHEQYPLGTISMGIQNRVSLSSNETQVAFEGHRSASKELNSTENGKVNEQHINGISVETREISTPKITPMETDVVVEVFPINSPSKITQYNDGSFEAGKVEVDLEQEETKRVEINSVISESSYSSLHENSVEHHSDQLLETSTTSTAKIITTEEELTSQTSNENLVFSGMEPKSSLENVESKSTSLSNQAAGSKYTSDSEKAMSTENRSKSWEGSYGTGRSAESEMKSFLEAFKAFIAAFVKFWTQ